MTSKNDVQNSWICKCCLLFVLTFSICFYPRKVVYFTSRRGIEPSLPSSPCLLYITSIVVSTQMTYALSSLHFLGHILDSSLHLDDIRATKPSSLRSYISSTVVSTQMTHALPSLHLLGFHLVYLLYPLLNIFILKVEFLYQELVGFSSQSI